MTGVTDWSIRTCPWPDCRATWVEDPVMYDDPDRCPNCGRHGDRFDYGPDRDLTDIGGGSARKRLFLYYQTSGIMPFVEGGNIKSAGALNEAEYRRA